jgi:hypothetical protein
MTRGSEKDYIKAAELTKRSAAFTGLTVGEALLAFLAFILWFHSPMPSKVMQARMSRLMVATQQVWEINVT